MSTRRRGRMFSKKNASECNSMPCLLLLDCIGSLISWMVAQLAGFDCYLACWLAGLAGWLSGCFGWLPRLADSSGCRAGLAAKNRNYACVPWRVCLESQRQKNRSNHSAWEIKAYCAFSCCRGGPRQRAAEELKLCKAKTEQFFDRAP